MKMKKSKGRPKGTHKCFPQRLTAREKKRIIAETRKGTKQIEIARAFGCNVCTIREVQRAAGLGRFAALTPELETRVVEMLKQGMGRDRVAKMVRLSGPLVWRIMREHGIVHKVGGLPLAKEKREEIAGAIKRRDDYC